MSDTTRWKIPTTIEEVAKAENELGRHELVVNGVRKEWWGYTIGYKEIVKLADGRFGFTVVYKGKSEAGTLTPGQWIGVEHGMIFNVADTSNA